MKKNALKYVVILLVFLIGISIGDLRKKNTEITESDPAKEELILSLQEMDENFFVKASKGVEKAIRYIFYIVFEFSSNIIKFVFGM